MKNATTCIMMEKVPVPPIEEKQTLKTLYNEFGEMSTVHGVKRAIVGRHCVEKFIWTLLVTTGGGLAFYQFISIVQEFQTNPISTVVSIEYEQHMEFPAVTICNLNRMKMSMASASIMEIFNRTREMNVSVEKQEMEFDILMSTISHPDKISLGHKMEDMLIDCKFNGERCTSNDFAQLYNIKYGNCYTFGQTKYDNKTKWYTTKTGPANGLILEMDIEQNDYLPLTPTAGIKVLLHPGSEIPFPEDGGITVGPGFVTNVGVKKEEIHRQPAPYGTCVQFNKAENLQRNMFAAYGYTYTDNACKKTCYQARVYNMCSCCDVDYPCIKKALLDVDVNEKISICNTSNQTILECVDQVERQFWTDERGCVQSCPPACNQTIYDTVISSAAWPSLNFVDSFIWNLNKAAASRNRTYNFEGNKQEFVQNNCLKLQIYYEVLNYVVIKTNPAYDWNKLLSDIGGQLGLWMGSSLLSAIELFQFVFEMLALLICKIFRNRTVANLEPSTTSN